MWSFVNEIAPYIQEYEICDRNTWINLDKFVRDKDQGNGRELELSIISYGMVNHDDIISEEVALFADAISGVWSPNPLSIPSVILQNVHYRNREIARSKLDFLVNFLPLRVKLNCHIAWKRNDVQRLNYHVTKNSFYAVNIKYPSAK